jgi:hypothetical protein
MSYDQYALIHAQQHREQQIADAAEHRLARLGRTRKTRRSPLRRLGHVLIRIGHALGAEPEAAPLRQAGSR